MHGHGGYCGDTKRGDEDIDDRDEEDSQNREVIYLVRFADFLLVVHVVSAVHDKTDSNCDLE